MLVTNNTNQDYYFGPLHLASGVGQSLTVDDTTATSLYLTDDSVADALNMLFAAGKIGVSGAATPFPRATGAPEVLHGDGSPEGLVYSPQGSLYMSRSAGSATNYLFSKTTGLHLNTGWVAINGAAGLYKPAKNSIANSASEADLIGTASSGYPLPAGAMGIDGIVRLILAVPLLNNSGAGVNYTLRSYFGGTKFYDSGAVSIAANANARLLLADLFVTNQGATNAQWAGGLVELGTSTAATTGIGNPLSQSALHDAVQGSALAIDTTVIQSLRVTFQFGTAAATITATPKVALLQLF